MTVTSTCPKQTELSDMDVAESHLQHILRNASKSQDFFKTVAYKTVEICIPLGNASLCNVLFVLVLYLLCENESEWVLKIIHMVLTHVL